MLKNTGWGLRNRRQERNLSQREVANYVGVTEATVSRWESGQIGNMRRDRIDKLARILDVSPLAVMGLKDFSDKQKTEPLEDSYLVKVPLVGSIACGTPVLADENVEGWEYVPKKYHADFALRAKGDSMTGDRIHDGDIVFVRQVSDVDDGDIAAVLVDGEATLKHVYKSDGAIILSAANPAFAPMVLREKDKKNVKVLGKAVAFQSCL